MFHHDVIWLERPYTTELSIGFKFFFLLLEKLSRVQIYVQVVAVLVVIFGTLTQKGPVCQSQ